MRRVLISDRVKRGWEHVVIGRALACSTILTIIGTGVAVVVDAQQFPLLSGAVAIVASSLVWFGAKQKYRIWSVISIASGGIICFIACEMIVEDWRYVLLGAFGVAVILRYYSEGPAS
jgi:hypothetical protein